MNENQEPPEEEDDEGCGGCCGCFILLAILFVSIGLVALAWKFMWWAISL